MGFKETKTSFDSKNHFRSEMARFVSEEAGQFTVEDNEAAAANVDAGFEKVARLSAEKNKTAIKEKQSDLKGQKASHPFLRKEERFVKKEMEQLQVRSENLHQAKAELNQRIEKKELSKEQIAEHKEKLKQEERFIQSESDHVFEKRNEISKAKLEKKETKSAKKKEQKKAAAKVSVANMLKAKKDAANDLAGAGGESGNAFTDANSGLIGTMATLANPMTYVKKLSAQLAALIAPYVLVFMTVAIIVVVLVALLFDVLMPIQKVGDAITGFLSIFTVESDTFTNVALTEDEIDQIVEDAECDETQEKVLRFALSKVGYPYSQELRTSGSAYDCSSLAYYAWNEAGTDISFGSGYPPTAAEGARVLNSKGKTVASEDAGSFSMEPGDLIYYGGSDNGRYLGIYHVAIYVGNGKAVEALNTKYGVVLQTLRTKNAIMVVRPNK